MTVPFEDDQQEPDTVDKKKQREPGDWFALIGTGLILGTLLTIIVIFLIWVLVKLVTILPW